MNEDEDEEGEGWSDWIKDDEPLFNPVYDLCKDPESTYGVPFEKYPDGKYSINLDLEITLKGSNRHWVPDRDGWYNIPCPHNVSINPGFVWRIPALVAPRADGKTYKDRDRFGPWIIRIKPIFDTLFGQITCKDGILSIPVRRRAEFEASDLVAQISFRFAIDLDDISRHTQAESG